MNFEIFNQIYLSRQVLLRILEEQGYDVAPFQNFSPSQIAVGAELLPALGFVAKGKENPSKMVTVIYTNFNRQTIDTYLSKNFQDAANNEVIYMLLDLIGDVHHALANKHWLTRKLKVRFFSTQILTFDPRTHYLVPKHELVPSEQHKALLESLHVHSKTQLPLIRYHADPIARILGAVPGDIIKITRPSPSAGIYVLYRAVAP